jgi:DNA-binding transcriptional regulator YiaG
MSERVEFFIEGKDLLATPYRYEAAGLDGIFLLNGVTTTDTAYGPMIHIENIHGLHRAIGLHIAEKPEPMTGPEFRFLRKQLELTQSALAKQMRVTDQTVANYEKGKTSLGSADAFMRALYLVHILPEQTRVAVLKPMIETAAAVGKKLSDLQRRKIVEGWSEQELAHAA